MDSPARIRHRKPRAFVDPKPLAEPALANLLYQSPLRYPGAKAGLSRYIRELVVAATPEIGRPQLFVEPFGGGAATSLRLIGDGVVDRILIADADPLVAALWRAASDDTDWLIDRMWGEPVSLERWDYWRAAKPRAYRELAVKCLFLNRTTFSGILHGSAGPIGGRAQSSAYPIGCRFNKTDVEQRIRYVGDLYSSGKLLDVWCKDWELTLNDVAEWYPQLLPNRVVAYLDPPYIEKSPKLYQRSFKRDVDENAKGIDGAEWQLGREHLRLAEYLRRRAQYRWILSYDNDPLLTASPALYAARRMTPSGEEKVLLGVREWRITRRTVTLRYSASGSADRRSAEELLLTTLPPRTVPNFTAAPRRRVVRTAPLQADRAGTPLV